MRNERNRDGATLQAVPSPICNVDPVVLTDGTPSLQLTLLTAFEKENSRCSKSHDRQDTDKMSAAPASRSSDPSTQNRDGSVPSKRFNRNPTLALLSQFDGKWATIGSQAPSSGAFEYFLRMCLTVEALTRRSTPSQPRGSIDVARSDIQDKQGNRESILSVKEYGLEYQLAQITADHFKLISMFVYNNPSSPEPSYPCFPLVFSIQVRSSQSSEAAAIITPAPATTRDLVIQTDTKAQHLVETLGEPTAKGGGELMRSGPSAWLLWELDMCISKEATATTWRHFRFRFSLSGDGSRGSDRWEKGRASECAWNSLSLEVI